MKNRQSIDRASNGINRRSFIAQTIIVGAGLAAVAAQNEVSGPAEGQSTQQTGEKLGDTRRLGKLEVSSIGLGVQKK
jgi:hypothetical protein